MPAVRRDPQLVIFDCDGVLVDSEVISNRVLAEMLSAEGLPTTLAQARLDYQGLLLADIRTRAEQQPAERCQRIGSCVTRPSVIVCSAASLNLWREQSRRSGELPLRASGLCSVTEQAHKDRVVACADRT